MNAQEMSQEAKKQKIKIKQEAPKNVSALFDKKLNNALRVGLTEFSITSKDTGLHTWFVWEQPLIEHAEDLGFYVETYEFNMLTFHSEKPAWWGKEKKAPSLLATLVFWIVLLCIASFIISITPTP